MQVSKFVLGALLVIGVLYAARGWIPSSVLEPILAVLGSSTESTEDTDLPEEGPSESGPQEPTSKYHLAAVDAFRRGDFSTALAALDECSGEAACLTLRGEMLMIGAGRSRSLADAMDAFTRAADLGNTDAQYALAILHANLKMRHLVANETAYRHSEALAVLYLYAASVNGHPGALMSMGYRHFQGYGVAKSCSTAALNYIEVAKRITDIYSAGMPQAVELIRLNLDGGKSRKAMSSSEINFFVQIASNGDTGVAAAIGKRYLLGIDGFRQNYKRAAHYLRIAADGMHGGALALLGYMYCLGLGLEKNLDTAYSYFMSSSIQKDALGHNGLGYIYFHGTSVQEQNLQLAFDHFNESAHGGSADGMFNLASMHLTGTGTDQSFQRAVMWYTQALDRGHTPAAYSLAIMHLNGVGTVRDCDIAVNLLKKVCERGRWVSGQLQEAYDQQETHGERTGWLFLKLAEAGHEVSQMNIAHLLDEGRFLYLFAEGPIPDDPGEELKALNRVYAQRFYEMSAEQGSASSELRLGDYAYYGWGVTADDPQQDVAGVDGSSDEYDGLPDVDAELQYFPQPVDYEASLAHYRKTSELPVSGEWMQAFVARAFFNLGFMHQFGLGVAPDLLAARRNYQRCLEVDPSGVVAPVSVMLGLLVVHAFVASLPEPDLLWNSLLQDTRFHLVILQVTAVLVLVLLRRHFARRLAATAPRATERERII